MKDEIKVNKANKSITFINNGIAFSQFGVADEILNLITNLQEENKRLKELDENYPIEEQLEEALKYENIYKSRNEKANNLLNGMLERAYIDGEYIMYDYSTSELLEVKKALQGEDKE